MAVEAMGDTLEDRRGQGKEEMPVECVAANQRNAA